MSGAEHPRSSAFIGGFKELSLFHFSLSTMPPDTHLACAGCDETLGTLEACAPRKAYASDLTKHRPSQCSSVLLTRKSFAGRKGFFFSLVAALLLCVHRWLRFFQCAAESAEYFCDHAPADIGQLFVSAGMQESEPVLIQTEEMQQRGVYVAHRDLFCGRSHGKLIRFAECRSRFHVASRHPDDEPILVVIATGLARRQIVVEWRAAHLGRPNHERFV